jgi:hypothetical protein
MEVFLLISVVFVAVLTQSISGFGVALVAMAFLPGLLGIQMAVPLVALVALTLEAVLLVRYRLSLNVRAVWPMILASFIGIPIGVWGLQGLDEDLILTVLGIVIAGYALYALFQFRLPDLRHPLWACGAGFLAGVLGGAYNTSGPPVIVYGDCRRWKPVEFKANLQGFFLLSDLFVVLNHALSDNLSAAVWVNYLWCLPAIAAGIILGLQLDRRVNPAAFRKVVLVLLVLLGVRLVI